VDIGARHLVGIPEFISKLLQILRVYLSSTSPFSSLEMIQRRTILFYGQMEVCHSFSKKKITLGLHNALAGPGCSSSLGLYMELGQKDLYVL
jgi:hypothetical protein